jgi:uncharacterized protein (DUF58 family)
MTDLQTILKKVRELEIKSKKITNHLFAGEYHSAFKGRGMHFKEVREYQAGDDIRFIDWNVSARLGHPYSKVFEEERELTMMLVVDVSRSSLFGTSSLRKKDLITEICALLAFAAIKNQDKVGAVLFSDRIQKYIPPKKGRDHILYLVRELLTLEPSGKSTDLAGALKFATNATKHKSIQFVLSDFVADQFEDTLKIGARKNDLIGIKVYDKMDMELPAIGIIEVEDAESGDVQWIDSSSATVRAAYAQQFREKEKFCQDAFKKAGADLLYIRTDEDYVRVLQQFFVRRS